jgi:hypothetical protein
MTRIRTCRFVVSLALLFLLLGCTGVPLKIPTEPLRQSEQSLGPVEGSAVGIMLFNVFPIGQNGRFGAAYAKALAQHEGATRLIDMEIQENWFWAYILNGYSFTVRGTAVK